MTPPNSDPRELPPFPLRVASILAAIVGAVTGLSAVTILMGAAGRSASLINGTAGVVMAIGLCAAAYLVWKRRKVGGWIVIVTLVLPSILVRVGSGVWHPPPLLLVLAALTLLSTWPLLR